MALGQVIDLVSPIHAIACPAVHKHDRRSSGTMGRIRDLDAVAAGGHLAQSDSRFRLPGTLRGGASACLAMRDKRRRAHRDESRSEALTGIIGARRACTVSMISPLSMPWR